MREKSQKKQSAFVSCSNADVYFLVVRNYRQWLIKKHRKMLKKRKEDQRRMMQMDEIDSESPIVVESSPHLNFYYSDQPWDIFNDDSAGPKSNRSSTHTFDQHSLSSQDERRKEKTAMFGSEWPVPARLHIFGDSFLPFEFISQQKGELLAN